LLGQRVLSYRDLEVGLSGGSPVLTIVLALGKKAYVPVPGANGVTIITISH